METDSKVEMPLLDGGSLLAGEKSGVRSNCPCLCQPLSSRAGTLHRVNRHSEAKLRRALHVSSGIQVRDRRSERERERGGKVMKEREKERKKERKKNRETRKTQRNKERGREREREREREKKQQQQQQQNNKKLTLACHILKSESKY